MEVGKWSIDLVLHRRNHGEPPPFLGHLPISSAIASQNHHFAEPSSILTGRNWTLLDFEKEIPVFERTYVEAICSMTNRPDYNAVEPTNARYPVPPACGVGTVSSQ
jgi:hypothetical protein